MQNYSTEKFIGRLIKYSKSCRMLDQKFKEKLDKELFQKVH